MGVYGGPNSAGYGLVLGLDAANTKSYLGSGITWTDMSGNGNNGTLTNGTTYNSANNGFLIFDGVDDKVVLPSSSSFAFGTGNLTVTGWAYITSHINSRTLATTRPNNSGYANAWHIGCDVNGTIFLYSNTTNLQSASNAVPTNQWFHWAFIRNTGSGSLFVNAIQVASGSVTNNYTLTQIGIGGYPLDVAEPWSGRIPQISIYNRALSASEIKQNYNSLAGRFATSSSIVRLLLNLDASNASSYGGSGTTWTDISGNGNNGTLINGPTYDSGSIVFDGTNDYVDLTSPIQFNNSDFSISGWFRSNSGNSNVKQIWNSGYDGGSPDIEIGVNNFLYFYVRPPGLGSSVQTSYSVDDNVWRYFTVTKTSSLISLYVNGILESSASGSFTSDVDNPGVIPRIGNGLNNINNRYFKGNISKISVYEGALSAAEVLQNYISVSFVSTPPATLNTLSSDGSQLVFSYGPYPSSPTVYISSSPYTSWTAYSGPGGGGRDQIAYANGFYFICGAINSAQFHRSPDGINWTACNISGNTSSTTYSFVYNSARSEWITGGGSWIGTNCVRKSTDGLNFSLTYTYPSGTSGSTYLATSNLNDASAYMYWMSTGSSSTTLSVARSQDATTWTESNWVSLNGTSLLRFLVYFNGRYWACNSSNVLGTTTDGLTWTSYSNANLDFQMIAAGSFTYRSVTYSYISGNNVFALSVDGTTWTKYNHSFSTLYQFNSVGTQVYATNGTSIYKISGQEL